MNDNLDKVDPDKLSRPERKKVCALFFRDLTGYDQSVLGTAFVCAINSDLFAKLTFWENREKTATENFFFVLLVYMFWNDSLWHKFFF